MTVERGLVIAGSVVAGTEWCLRDSDAWWQPGERGTRQRAARIDLLAGHWTGGEAGTGDPDGNAGPLTEYDDDGPRVVRGMKSRRRPDGTLMDVSIHFVIGASAPFAPFAQVWQTADPGLTACCHISRNVNPRSVGVEVVSAGMPGQFDTRERPRVSVPLLGRIRTVLRFYDGQLASWVRLAEALAGVKRAGIDIPRRVPVFGASRRFTAAEGRQWAGAMEHMHSPTTTKLDAAGLLVAELLDHGWELAT